MSRVGSEVAGQVGALQPRQPESEEENADNSNVE
jgi:hypothetical protein